MEKRYYYLTPEDYATAEANGINGHTLYSRVYDYGWDVERAINEKPKKRTSYGKYTRIAQENGIERQLLYYRIKQGMDPEEAARKSPITPEERLEKMWAARKYRYEKELQKALANGIKKTTFESRIRRGWSIEDAINTPLVPNDGSRNKWRKHYA